MKSLDGVKVGDVVIIGKNYYCGTATGTIGEVIETRPGDRAALISVKCEGVYGGRVLMVNYTYSAEDICCVIDHVEEEA